MGKSWVHMALVTEIFTKTTFRTCTSIIFNRHRCPCILAFLYGLCHKTSLQALSLYWHRLQLIPLVVKKLCAVRLFAMINENEERTDTQSQDGAGRPEGRSRKKAIPQRRLQVGEKRHESGDSCSSKKRKCDADENGKAQKRGKGEKDKVKRDGRQATSLEFEDPGGCNFDALQVAGAFIRNDFAEGRDSLGTLSFDQFATAARLYALETNKVVL
jgi:hypothetical protein